VIFDPAAKGSQAYIAFARKMIDKMPLAYSGPVRTI
jgi:hypothetical protein